jgi:hypothetical protein
MKLLAVLATAIAPLCVIAASNNNNAGNVQFYLRTSSAFNVYTDNPSASLQNWIFTHFWRMQSNSTYFDKKLSWMPNTWDYVDLYGINTKSPLVQQHPEWILRDSAGNKLYIPFGCSNGVCASYAGDITNAAFRSNWISSVQTSLAAGYKGMWLDDVNMEFRVGNGSGVQVAPIDNNTHTTMTWDNWRKYVAQFVQQIRGAFPTYEIVHNSIWYAAPNRTADPYVIQQIQAADYINCERGVSDPGLTGGTGSWSLNAFLSYIDVVHSYGKNVLLDEYNFNGDYGLAGYFLISNGGDSVGNQDITPDNWWTGYQTQLGAPSGDRYTWNGLLRRDFSGGMVLLNPPQSATITVTLPVTATKIDDGSRVNSVTLGASQAVVLTTSSDFSLSLSSSSQTLTAGATSTVTANVSLFGGFLSTITFGASGVPSGTTVSFSPSSLSLGGSSTVSIATSATTPPGVYSIVVSGVGGGATHTSTISLTVKAAGNSPGMFPVALSSAFNRTGVVADGATFSGGMDTWGYAYSGKLLGSTVTVNSVVFSIGASNTLNVVAGGNTVQLPTGQYASLNVLASAVNGNQGSQKFKVTYTDGTSATLTQSLSDWATPQSFSGETKAVTMAYRDTASGGKDNRTFYLYGYTFSLDRTRAVSTVTLPSNSNVVVVAMTLTASIPVNIGPVATKRALVTDGKVFTDGGIDGYGNAYSANLLGTSLQFNGITYGLGTADSLNAAASTTIALPSGHYSGLGFLGTGVNGNQSGQTFKVTYTDGSSTSFKQSMSNWSAPASYAGETVAATTSYRDKSTGVKELRTFYLFGYMIALDNTKTVQSFVLPANSNAVVVAATLTQ